MLTRSLVGEHAKEYADALTHAETLEQLRALVEDYCQLALDAWPIAQALTDDEFQAFRAGLKKERRGQFAGHDWATRFGAILLPWPMFRIALLAEEYKVPFGLAWARYLELRPDLLSLTP